MNSSKMMLKAILSKNVVNATYGKGSFLRWFFLPYLIERQNGTKLE